MKSSNILTEPSGPVNILQNGVKMETRPIPIGSEIAKESSLSSVRKLPKKRKFDLSELEEPSYSKPEVSATNSSTVNCTANITPPQSTAVDYSYISGCGNGNLSDNAIRNNCFDSSPPKLTPPKLESNHYFEAETKAPQLQEYYKPNVNFSVPSINVSGAHDRNDATEKLNVALHEWIDHRVLAKRNGVYVPGMIRKADSTVGCVWVEFDNVDDLVVFSDVLLAGRYDVISDASPSISQVSVGDRVCVRTSVSLVDEKHPMSRIFVEGVVDKILKSPVRFVVRLTCPENKEYIVKRADICLLQPPWLDELENDSDRDLPPPLVRYGPPSNANSEGNTSAIVTTSSYQPACTNQLDAASLRAACKSAATSPLRVTPVTLNSSYNHSVPSVGVEDQRRRHFDEYCESDDDLRKENILFSTLEGNIFEVVLNRVTRKYFNYDFSLQIRESIILQIVVKEAVFRAEEVPRA